MSENWTFYIAEEVNHGNLRVSSTQHLVCLCLHLSRGAAFPTKLHVRQAKTNISFCIRAD